jgi:hypothetical protein
MICQCTGEYTLLFGPVQGTFWSMSKFVGVTACCPKEIINKSKSCGCPFGLAFHRKRAHLENTSGTFRLIRLQQCSRRAEKESHSIQYYAAHAKKYLIGVRQRPS